MLQTTEGKNWESLVGHEALLWLHTRHVINCVVVKKILTYFVDVTTEYGYDLRIDVDLIDFLHD